MIESLGLVIGITCAFMGVALGQAVLASLFFGLRFLNRSSSSEPHQFQPAPDEGM